MTPDRFRRAPRGYPGYAPLAVEMFLARCDEALRSGGFGDPVSVAEIATVDFPLVKTGYLRAAVDRELALIAQRLGAATRPPARNSLVAGFGAGQDMWRWAAHESSELVAEVLGAAGRPFALVPRWRAGYASESVDLLTERVVAALETWPQCTLRHADLLGLRLPQRRGGYDAEAVDGFFDRAAAVLQAAGH